MNDDTTNDGQVIENYPVKLSQSTQDALERLVPTPPAEFAWYDQTR